MNHPWLDDPAVRKKAETLMREQATQSNQPIRSNYQPNPPIRGTNLQMAAGQQPMRGQQQPLKPSNQINGPGVTLTLMKRPVPMDVDTGWSLPHCYLFFFLPFVLSLPHSLSFTRPRKPFTNLDNWYLNFFFLLWSIFSFIDSFRHQIIHSLIDWSSNSFIHSYINPSTYFLYSGPLVHLSIHSSI